MKKPYKISIILIILGIISFTSSMVGSMNSYVRADGLLIEPFGQIVMGAMFGFVFTIFGIITGLSFSIWSYFHTSSNQKL